MTETCCCGTCQKDAEYEVTDVADLSEQGTTFACAECVGHVLSHSERVEEGAVDLWEVRPLA